MLINLAILVLVGDFIICLSIIPVSSPLVRCALVLNERFDFNLVFHNKYIFKIKTSDMIVQKKQRNRVNQRIAINVIIVFWLN